MSAVVGYLLNMLPYMLIAIPIFVIIRFIIFKKTGKLNLYRETALLIFSVFSVGLASQTVIPKLEFGINGQISIIGNGISEINLIPFKVLFDTYKEAFVNGYINYFIINFLGNIIIFMPIGFFIPLLRKTSNKKVILTGFLVSFFIEFCQLFLQRNTDVDDLILNTLGVALGLIVYRLLDKKFADFFNKFK